MNSGLAQPSSRGHVVAFLALDDPDDLLLVSPALPATTSALELPSPGPDEGLDVAAGTAGRAELPVGLPLLAGS